MELKKAFLIFGLAAGVRLFGQVNIPSGDISGNFQSLNQFYFRDDRIGANTIQYRRQKTSTEAWLFLNYKISGFDIQARYDLFNNSPLLNPQSAYSNAGLGFWQINKSIQKLSLTAGYFYDQFGSGTIFRAYEDRLIGLDYAVQGVKASYRFDETFEIKAFSGQQKGFLDLSNNEDSRFRVTPQILMGMSALKFFQIRDSWSLETNAGIINNTLDQNTLNNLVSEISSFADAGRIFEPKSNTYAYNVGATARYKDFAFEAEYNGLSNTAQRNLFNQDLYTAAGHVWFGSLSYSTKGFGANVQYKKVQDFQFRTSPNYILLNGMATYLPSITRQNVYRLLARYAPAVQLMGETAYQGDFIYSPNKKFTFNLNLSKVDQFDDEKLYREIYIDGNYKIDKHLKLMLGIQYVEYNQKVYQINALAPFVYATTPFTEVSYKIDKKKSVRVEAQYMHCNQDLGSFINGLVEYNVSPHWSISAGDMVNTNTVRTPGTPQEALSDEIIHYYNFFVAYNLKNTRFVLNYLKQVQGVNCTGGICRVEPAFSGIKAGLTTNF